MGTVSGGNPRVHVGRRVKGHWNHHTRKGSSVLLGPPPALADNYGGREGLPATDERPVLRAVQPRSSPTGAVNSRKQPSKGGSQVI